MGGKYPDYNWERGMNWSVPYDCMVRHVEAWFSGEDLDPDTGLPHLSAAAANLAMLIEYELTKNGKDDRPKGRYNVTKLKI